MVKKKYDVLDSEILVYINFYSIQNYEEKKNSERFNIDEIFSKFLGVP